jgi:hypothetical protein
MSIKAIKLNLNKYQKHIQFYQMNKTENNTIQQDYSQKECHKWDQKHHKEISKVYILQ